MSTTAGEERAPGGLALQDEDNLPPVAFEPGVVGAAQKGVSAIVIAFGAAAFSAIAWGVSVALFPSANSTTTVFNEAFEQVRVNGDVCYKLGTPLRAFGADRGSDRGRRNAFERWEVEEEGQERSVVRFNVAGPNGVAVCQVQVPRDRKRGDFNYIIVQHRRDLVHVLDRRGEEAAAKPIAQPPAPIEPAAATALPDALPPSLAAPPPRLVTSPDAQPAA